MASPVTNSLTFLFTAVGGALLGEDVVSRRTWQVRQRSVPLSLVGAKMDAMLLAMHARYDAAGNALGAALVVTGVYLCVTSAQEAHAP